MPVEQGLPWHPVATGLAGHAIPFVVVASRAHALPSPPFWFPVPAVLVACVTFRLVVAPLRGPGQSPVLPFACCVGLLLSVGRCGRCSPPFTHPHQKRFPWGKSEIYSRGPKLETDLRHTNFCEVCPTHPPFRGGWGHSTLHKGWRPLNCWGGGGAGAGLQPALRHPGLPGCTLLLWQPRLAGAQDAPALPGSAPIHPVTLPGYKSGLEARHQPAPSVFYDRLVGHTYVCARVAVWLVPSCGGGQEPRKRRVALERGGRLKVQGDV